MTGRYYNPLLAPGSSCSTAVREGLVPHLQGAANTSVSPTDMFALLIIFCISTFLQNLYISPASIHSSRIFTFLQTSYMSRETIHF